MAINYVQTNTLYLAGSGVIIGATSATLTSFTDIYANVLTMASFGAKGFITFEPDTTNEEAATFTGVTANANGTYTLTGLKTVLAQTPYTESTGLVRQHSGGTKIVVTDNVAFWNTFGNKQNDETLTGRWGTAVVPSSGNDIVNKTYADGLAIAGAPNASTTVKGIGEVSVAPVSPTIPIFVGDNDGRVPTQNENNALVGNNTDIAVSTGNKFVTQTGLIHNAEKYAADAGSNDTYVITLSPIPTSYTTGMVVYFKANTVNTGAATINVNSLGAKTIVKGVNTTLADGDIAAGMFCTLIYDGTNFVLQNPIANIIRTNKIITNGVLQALGGGSTTVFTVSIPGGTLSTSNAIKVKVFLDGYNQGAVSNAVFTLTYGSTSGGSVGINTTSGDGVTGGGIAEFAVIATGATNTQMIASEMYIVPVGFSTTPQARGGGAHSTAAEDSTTTLNLSLVWNGGATLNITGYIIELVS